MSAISSNDTDSLLNRAAQGDKSAVAELFDRQRPRLRKLIALRMDVRVSARVDPSDVIQEAMMDATRTLHRFLRERRLPFYPWLRQIALTRLMQVHRFHLQTQRRTVRREVDLLVSDRSGQELTKHFVAHGSSPSDRAERDENRRRIQSAVALLSATDREVLILRYVERLLEIQPTLAALADWGEHMLPSRGDVGSAARASGDFHLISVIGRGGMGIVYEAEQLSLGRRVAVKVLPFAALLDQRQLQRFKNEARAAAMLKHPGIVSVHAVGVERGVHFYVMELIEGMSLAEVANHLRNVPPAAAVDNLGSASRSSPPGNASTSAELETEPLAQLSTQREQDRQSFIAAWRGLVCKPPRHCTMPTGRASSTGTSSRRIYYSIAKANCTSPTSGSLASKPATILP